MIITAIWIFVTSIIFSALALKEKKEVGYIVGSSLELGISVITFIVLTFYQTKMTACVPVKLDTKQTTVVNSETITAV